MIPWAEKMHLIRSDLRRYGGILAIFWKFWLDNTEPTRVNYQTGDVGTSRMTELVFQQEMCCFEVDYKYVVLESYAAIAKDVRQYGNELWLKK